VPREQVAMADDVPRREISVAMIAYQHEAYIAQAVDSVLMQDVDRSIELVIGDDCSSDRTSVILEAYARAHPDTIRLLSTPSRLGAQPNFARTLKACRGRYIALLEGDDFWTDRQKLRRQAEYLDTDPSCSMCFQNVEVLSPDGTTLFNRPDQKPISTIEDLFERHFMATCSVMYRAGLFGEFPAWFYSFPCGDWPLCVLNARHGAIGYIDEVMATYRKHGDGLWSGLSAIERLEMRLKCYPTLLAHAGPAYVPVARPAMSHLHYLLALRYARRGRVLTASGHAIRSILLAPRRRREWLKPFGRFIQHRLRELRSGTPMA
jgi:glycosyltransferase involved in cell wall biosynthesis